MKIKVIQAQNNWFVFKETPFTNKGCTDLHTHDMNKVTEFENSYARWCCESIFFCNYHWSKWYQKQTVFNQLVIKATFWSFFHILKTFAFWKELVCLFYKSILPFLTFVNCKGPYRETSSQHDFLSMFWYCVYVIRSHSKSKE